MQQTRSADDILQNTVPLTLVTNVGPVDFDNHNGTDWCQRHRASVGNYLVPSGAKRSAGTAISSAEGQGTVSVTLETGGVFQETVLENHIEARCL